MITLSPIANLRDVEKLLRELEDLALEVASCNRTPDWIKQRAHEACVPIRKLARIIDDWYLEYGK